MVLRHLTKNINDQNWFAVWLEMFVVIISIFLGLQVSDWNEERQNIIKGQNYLERIAKELEQDIRFFDATIRVNNEGAENGMFLLNTLSDEDLVRNNPTKFIQTINRLGGTFKINVSDNTFEELKFSGKLELINNVELRAKIADYYDFIEMEGNWSHARILVENTYNSRNTGILKIEQMGRTRPSDEEVFTVEEALEAYEKFKQKQLLIEWIPAVISRKRGNVSFDTGAQRRAKSLLEEINVELTS